MLEKQKKNQAEWDRIAILEGEAHRRREAEAEKQGGRLPTPPMLIHEVAKLSEWGKCCIQMCNFHKIFTKKVFKPTATVPLTFQGK